MTHAYNESYLNDAMQNLGDMMDYAIRDLGYDGDEFFSYFLASDISKQFEQGNPKYVCGMSGVELVNQVLSKVQNISSKADITVREYDGPEFWCGWTLAYYQWYSRLRFEDIINNGLTISKILSMYILHEADLSKFVKSADSIISNYKHGNLTNLKRIRQARGFTQKQLAEQSGVTLRMIQLYEQRKNDINKASVEVVINLAKALGCKVEDLTEINLKNS